MAIVTDPGLLAQLNAPTTVTDPAILAQLNQEEAGPMEGFKQGLMGRPGTGVGHFIGAAVLPTAGAVIGSIAGPGGSVAGAAAGESVKEAIGAGYEVAHGLPQSKSTVEKVLGPAEAAAGQAVGEKYMAPAFGKAWDAAGWVGRKIAQGLAWTSKIPKGSMTVLQDNAADMLSKVGTVNTADLKLSADRLLSAIENTPLMPAKKAAIIDGIKGVVADKDPLTKMSSFYDSKAWDQFRGGVAQTDPEVSNALTDFFNKSIILGLSGPIIAAAPADEFGRHLLQYSAAGALGHALGTTIPAVGIGIAITNPAVVRTTVGLTNIAAGAAERKVAAVAQSAAAPIINKAASAIATQAGRSLSKVQQEQ